MVNQQPCQSDGFFEDYCLISLFRGKNQLGHLFSGSWKRGSGLGGGRKEPWSHSIPAAVVGGGGAGRSLTRAGLTLELIRAFTQVAVAQSISTVQCRCKSSDS